MFAGIMGWFAAGKSTLGWDLRVSATIQSWHSSLGEQLYRIGDILGATAIVLPVILLCLIIPIVRKDVLISLFLMLVIIMRVVGAVLKPIFASPRPSSDQIRLMGSFDGYGYPSGHSTTIAMAAALIIILTWHSTQKTVIRATVTVLSILAMLFVGWSRIWGGAHWPSDVLAGWSVGIALVLIAWVMSLKIGKLPLLKRDSAVSSARHQ